MFDTSTSVAVTLNPLATSLRNKWTNAWSSDAATPSAVAIPLLPAPPPEVELLPSNQTPKPTLQEGDSEQALELTSEHGPPSV